MPDHDRQDIDEFVLREIDAGWVRGTAHLKPSESDLDHLLKFFDPISAELRPFLPSALRRAYGSLVTTVPYERGRDPGLTGSASTKPSTSVARDLAKLGEAAEILDNRLAQLDPVTSAFLAERLDELSLNGDASEKGWNLFLEQLYWSPDILHHAARLGEGVSKKGPNQAALKIMVRARAPVGSKL